MFNSKLILTLLLIVLIGMTVVNYSTTVVKEIFNFEQTISDQNKWIPQRKSKEIYAKGLYLTAHSANNPTKRQQIIDLINSTELNTVVIDIKDYTGYILYDSDITEANNFATKKVLLQDTEEIIADFKKNDIYVIARQTVFQDPALANAKPEWAIKNVNGGIWHDYKGLSWVDPTRKEIWKYNLDIAEEAALLGFDEINFDYVRFPSDGDIRLAGYAALSESKEATMREFFQYIKKRLHRKSTYTSVDFFGLTLESHDFDLNIGQRLELALDNVDYIYPMTYPSHYPVGHLGYANPADYPYEILYNGLVKSSALMTNTNTKLRPWLQAFNIGAVYDAAKIEAQIRAVEESEYTQGWILWNASNRYTEQGLNSGVQ